MIYWTDQEYWGVGLGAHSYIKEPGPTSEDTWGKRFWNPNNIHKYTKKMETLSIQRPSSIVDYRDSDHYEILAENQALTDYCHVFLRIKQGLSLEMLGAKFGQKRQRQVAEIFQNLHRKGLVEEILGNWRLTPEGVLISNRVFEECTFLV
jgi:oxygen-independent coproporphyrinogen-3 oxidase